MANFIILNRLRRCISTTSISHPLHFHIRTIPNPNSASLLRPSPCLAPTKSISLAGALGSFSSRSIFTRADSEFSASTDVDSATELAAGSKVVDSCLSGGGEELFFPVRSVISMLDGVHNLTGLPWWIVIASSILAVRVALLPLLIFQLHKLKRIGELFNKLPYPIPPPNSGKSYIDQFLLFREKKKEIGCPSFLWFLPYISVQVPCFFLWMTSIRRMSLDQHTGFDCGGTLWFQDLTEFSHGALGFVLPVVIAGFHYANVQLSFRTPLASKTTSLLNLLVKYYKIYLDFLTLPIFLTCYYVPQGSLVYWATNSSITYMQQLILKGPSVRAKLGLLDPNPMPMINSESNDSPAITASSEPEINMANIEDLSPKELISISHQLLSEQHIERAIYILQLALAKDPDYTSALILMGQTLLQKGLVAEAVEHLERVVSKLMLYGHPIEEEDIDHLILASMWMGAAYCRQGRFQEGIVHFERIGNLKEPDDPEIKSHYYDGLLMLASALHNVGRREEAVKYLRSAAAYNPAYKEFLLQCEHDDDPFVELTTSRRQDY